MGREDTEKLASPGILSRKSSRGAVWVKGTALFSPGRPHSVSAGTGFLQENPRFHHGESVGARRVSLGCRSRSPGNAVARTTGALEPRVRNPTRGGELGVALLPWQRGTPSRGLVR